MTDYHQDFYFFVLDTSNFNAAWICSFLVFLILDIKYIGWNVVAALNVVSVMSVDIINVILCYSWVDKIDI